MKDPRTFEVYPFEVHPGPCADSRSKHVRFKEHADRDEARQSQAFAITDVPLDTIDEESEAA